MQKDFCNNICQEETLALQTASLFDYLVGAGKQRDDRCAAEKRDARRFIQ